MSRIVEFIRTYPLSLISLILITVMLYIQPISSSFFAGLNTTISGLESLASFPLRSKRELILEIDRLREENNALQREVVDRFGELKLDRANAASENIQISGYRAVRADVIATSQLNELEIIVTAGDFNIGDIVVNDANQVVGEIVRIGNSTATIRLVFDQRTSFLARLARPDTVEFLVSGTSSFNLKADFVGKSSSIEQGDLVLTSGTEPGVPFGLILGTVVDIEDRESDPFIEARISPGLNRMDLLHVIVLSQDYEGL